MLYVQCHGIGIDLALLDDDGFVLDPARGIVVCHRVGSAWYSMDCLGTANSKTNCCENCQLVKRPLNQRLSRINKALENGNTIHLIFIFAFLYFQHHFPRIVNDDFGWVFNPYQGRLQTLKSGICAPPCSRTVAFKPSVETQMSLFKI